MKSPVLTNDKTENKIYKEDFVMFDLTPFERNNRNFAAYDPFKEMEDFEKRFFLSKPISRKPITHISSKQTFPDLQKKRSVQRLRTVFLPFMPSIRKAKKKRAKKTATSSGNALTALMQGALTSAV